MGQTAVILLFSIASLSHLSHGHGTAAGQDKIDLSEQIVKTYHSDVVKIFCADSKSLDMVI